MEDSGAVGGFYSLREITYILTDRLGILCPLGWVYSGLPVRYIVTKRERSIVPRVGKKEETSHIGSGLLFSKGVR